MEYIDKDTYLGTKINNILNREKAVILDEKNKRFIDYDKMTKLDERNYSLGYNNVKNN